MSRRWIVAALSGALVLAATVAIATGTDSSTGHARTGESGAGRDPCSIEQRGSTIRVEGVCDHTIVILEGAETLAERSCDRSEETLCEQGDDEEVHDCDQRAAHAQIIVQICNLELLEDANVNDAVDVVDDNDLENTDLTLRDLLDATVNATL